MSTVSLNPRATYTSVSLQEMSASNADADSASSSAQTNLEVTNVSSVCERMQTAGRNLKEAGAKVAAWMVNHPLESGILVGGLALTSGALMLGVGLGVRATACPNSGASGSTSGFLSGAEVTPNPTSRATSASRVPPDSASRVPPGSASRVPPDSATGVTPRPAAPRVTPDSNSASAPLTDPQPLKINCSVLRPFSFNVSQGQGFTLKESNTNTLLLQKKPSNLTQHTEFSVDPKTFCEGEFFSGKGFSLHCDADNKDYSLSAEALVNKTILDTGACAVQAGVMMDYLVCEKSKSKQVLECKENVEKFCEKNVQNLKLTIPPSGKDQGSVFITERSSNGEDEYRLFFTNFDTKENKYLSVNVKQSCKDMLDAPLEFECSGVNQGTKVGFTLRQNLTAVDGEKPNFKAGACAFDESKPKVIKSCSIKFGERSQCGDLLGAMCDDKMVMLMSGKGPVGKKLRRLTVTASKSDGSTSTSVEGASSADPFMAKGSDCHVVRRKIKTGYNIGVRSVCLGSCGVSGSPSEAVSESYHTVNITYSSVAFLTDKGIPEGYERPCGSSNEGEKNPTQQNTYSVPRCENT